MSCTCKFCVAGCHNTPGWMTPEDLDNIAAYLNVCRKTLFENLLVVDHRCGFGEKLRVLGPATLEDDPGTEQENLRPRGTCVFCTAKGRCSIHAVKPAECAKSYGCVPNVSIDDASERDDVADSWRNPSAQGVIEGLLK